VTSPVLYYFYIIHLATMNMTILFYYIGYEFALFAYVLNYNVLNLL
jgi:hypothetical protein